MLKLRCKTILLALIFVFLIGCNADTTKAVKPNLRSISFTVDITYYNESYTADCIIGSSGDFRVVMTSPDSLNGLLLEYSGNNCKVSYNELVIDNAESFFPQISPVKLLKEVITNSESAQLVQDDKKIIMKGNHNGKKYYLSLAPTGLPLALDFPDYGMSVAFKNVAVLNE